MPAERAGPPQEVIEAKAQLPGATKRGIYEYLLDRCYAGEEPPAYNTLTKWMRRNGIECGRLPEGPSPIPASRRRPASRCSSTGRSPCAWPTPTARCSSSASSRPRWATPGSTGSSTPGRAPRTTSWRACWR